MTSRLALQKESYTQEEDKYNHENSKQNKISQWNIVHP
jgi:hypothetical protein